MTLTTRGLITRTLTTRGLKTRTLTTRGLSTKTLTTRGLTTRTLTTRGLTTRRLTTRTLTTRTLTTRIPTTTGLKTWREKSEEAPRYGFFLRGRGVCAQAIYFLCLEQIVISVPNSYQTSTLAKMISFSH